MRKKSILLLPVLLLSVVGAMAQNVLRNHGYYREQKNNIRYEIDKLELIVEDGLWTLPKYRELLFIR